MTDSSLPSRDRFSWLYLSLASTWAIVLWWLLLSEPKDLALLRAPTFLLNFGHALVFAPLGALLYLGLPKCHAFVLLSFVLAGGYGALMEILQTWVPGRIGDPIDGMTNVFGVALGISTLVALSAWREGSPGRGRSLRLPLLFLLASLGSALLATLA